MEHVKTFSQDGFRLDLWDTGHTDEYGKSILHYALFDEQQPNGKGIVFEGTGYRPSPLHAIDSDESVAGILSFLSLGEGDTDSEYFDNYTETQLTWRDSQRREELSMIAHELEEDGA
jgi:hypothetical protein